MLAEKLKFGDTIGVTGVSSSATGDSLTYFYEAEKFLTQQGFRVKRGKYVLEDDHGSAGTRFQKAEDMMDMFLDDEVKAIVCLNGGDTCNTFLDLLDYEEIKKHPKIVVGYSNVTVLLMALQAKAGLTCFSGPNFVDFGREKCVGQYPVFIDAFVNGNTDRFKNCEMTAVREGDMKGKLLGTNMGTMIHILGTEFFPDVTGAVLALEVFSCPHNKCQYILAQLKQHKVFDRVNGIIVGYNHSFQAGGAEFPQLEDWLLDYTREYSFPIFKCNSFGHVIVNSVLPIGSEIEVKDGKINYISDFLI
ncbi:MAG: LD-carboxypeptidase [Clostridia bacterium]|nr:LD-carboxypeptidase [Clostridia bacterium]